MKRLLPLLLLLSLAACRDNQDDAGARDLLERLQDERYRGWTRPPGWETRRPTSAPHADDVDVYVNDVLAAALAGGPIDAWPEGSVVVKDGFSGGDLEIVAVMEKRSSGWYFAEYGSEGDPLFSGRPGVCLGCHVEENDRILAFDLPR